MTSTDAAHSPPAAALAPTWFVDADHPAVVDFARRAVGSVTDQRTRAVRLFYAVRDEIRYTAYGLDMRPEAFRASHVLANGRGWCATKSCLLAAAARAVGIGCRLGYANVRNHLATEKLLRAMGTDIFYYHGYNELWIDNRWVKATVAFNRSLCEKARIAPQEFDGVHDSLYHPFDLEGRRHMEYLHDYGAVDDVPHAAIVAKFAEVYPRMAELVKTPGAQDDQAGAWSETSGDFEADIAREAAGKEDRPAER